MTGPALMRRLVDALLPVPCPVCGRHLDGHRGLCASCLRDIGPARLDGDLLHLGGYARGLERSVRALKFGGRRAVAGPLGRRLGEGVRASGWTVDAIVPVPLHISRRLRRGYNQAELLAAAIAAYLDRPVRPVLQRVRRTSAQTGLQREQRAANVAGAFRATADLSGLELLLVDDVHTTGATARACRQALRDAGARRVRIAVISRA